MKTYSKAELKLILDLHSKWNKNENEGQRANLSETNLSGVNLSGANLSRAYLSGANLSETNLSEANLSEAYLPRANLSGANLSGAYLSRVDLSGANLSETNLSGANLSGAYIPRANLVGADLSRANLLGAYLFNTCVYSFALGAHFGYAWKKDKKTIIKIGCEEHALKVWLKDYKKIGTKHNYTKEMIKTYILQIKLIKACLK